MISGDMKPERPSACLVALAIVVAEACNALPIEVTESVSFAGVTGTIFLLRGERCSGSVSGSGPYPGVTIRVSAEERSVADDVTDRYGAFSVSLAPGTYTVGIFPSQSYGDTISAIEITETSGWQIDRVYPIQFASSSDTVIVVFAFSTELSLSEAEERASRVLVASGLEACCLWSEPGIHEGEHEWIQKARFSDQRRIAEVVALLRSQDGVRAAIVDGAGAACLLAE